MSRFKLGNAPCSWGTIEGTGTEAERIPYTQMLDELVMRQGYAGTELGDYGFMPMDAAILAGRARAPRPHHAGRVCRCGTGGPGGVDRGA